MYRMCTEKCYVYALLETFYFMIVCVKIAVFETSGAIQRTHDLMSEEYLTLPKSSPFCQSYR